MVQRSLSLADQIFEKLEKDILAGSYQRGDILTEAKLCEELGVSRTPVREALRMLEQEHIIEDTGKGLLVLGITLNDAEMIYEIRKRVEGLAAAECARNATEDQIREMTDVLDLQEFYANKKDSEMVKVQDSEFHQMIYRYCGSAVLYDTLVPLHKKIQKFRKKSVEGKGRASQSIEEHRTILNAIRGRDPEAAEAAMIEHVGRAQKHVELMAELESAEN